MLEAAIARARQVVVGPFSQRVEPWPVGLVPCALIDVCECQEDDHGVDVLGGAAGGKTVAEPVLDDFEVSSIAGELIILPQAEQADTVCPFLALSVTIVVQKSGVQI